MVILQFALVASKPLFDTRRRCVEAALRLVCFSRSMKDDSGVQMHFAVARKMGGRFLNRYLSRIPPIEIFRNRQADSIFDPLTERFTDLHMFTRYTHTHGIFLFVVICEYQLTSTHALIQAFPDLSGLAAAFCLSIKGICSSDHPVKVRASTLGAIRSQC
ncbi:hypothetical protein D3C80_1652370 [compost metagenome]